MLFLLFCIDSISQIILSTQEFLNNGWLMVCHMNEYIIDTKDTWKTGALKENLLTLARNVITAAHLGRQLINIMFSTSLALKESVSCGDHALISEKHARIKPPDPDSQPSLLRRHGSYSTHWSLQQSMLRRHLAMRPERLHFR